MFKPALGLLIPVTVALAVAAACNKINPDVGQPCRLYKGITVALEDGGSETSSAPVKVADIGDAGDQDVVSVSSPDCSFSACVLDHYRVATEIDRVRPRNLDVMGYCSQKCDAPEDKVKCADQHDKLETVAGNAMTCKTLLLDPAVIASYCTDDNGVAGSGDAKCLAAFGTTRAQATPFFCVRGPPVDVDAGS